MTTHVNTAFVVKYDNDQYVAGDSFWPKLVDKTKMASRIDTFNDAKKFVKTATARLKKDGYNKPLAIVKVEVTRDESFKVIKVKEVT